MTEAYKIANQNLIDCICENGIVAGKHHYDDYWTRDAYFGWLGANIIGKNEIVKKHLMMLTATQKSNGLISFLIRRNIPGLTFIGKRVRIKDTPQYRSHKALFTSYVIDSNAYYVLGAIDYYNTTRDEKFLAELKPNIEKALDWYLTQLDQNGLIKEGLIAQWNDGVYKKGNVLITNLQVWRAFSVVSKMWNSQKHKEQADKLKNMINEVFWNGEFYSDWKDGNTIYKHFDSIANLLAIIWDFTEEAKTKSILEFNKKNLCINPLVKSAFPPYASNKLDIFNKIAGMGDYWGGKDIYWIEPGLLYALALHKTGNVEEAKEVFENIARLVKEFDGVYEVYIYKDKKFQPLITRLYTSEKPYARGAGLFIEVANQLLA